LHYGTQLLMKSKRKKTHGNKGIETHQKPKYAFLGGR
jgi:hypothetical protein